MQPSLVGAEYDSSSESDEENVDATAKGPTKKDALEIDATTNNKNPQLSSSTVRKQIVPLSAHDQLPPELARELNRARKRGEPIIPATLQDVDATKFSSDTTTLLSHTKKVGTGAAKLISANSMRRSGVTKAARRNHHISELVAKVRAERSAIETINSLGGSSSTSGSGNSRRS